MLKRMVLFTFVIGFLLMSGGVFSAGWAYEISDVEVKMVGVTTYITIKADSPIVFEDFMMDQPHRIVIDCQGAQNRVRGSVLEDLNVKGVRAIRIGQRDLFEQLPQPTVRIVIDLEERASHMILVEGNNLVVAIDTLGFSEGEGIPHTEPTTSPPPQPQPTTPKMDDEYLPPITEESPSPDSPQYIPGRDYIIVEEPPMRSEDEIKKEQLKKLEEEKLISFDLIDADVRNVLRFLADYGGVNIVASNSVGGRVTMRLIDVPWRRAMELILDVGSFTAYEEDDGIVRVVTQSEYDQIEREELRKKQELEQLLPLETEVIKVRYATASELVGPLLRLKSSKGNIQADARTNSLIITDLPEYIGDIKELLTKLDTYIPQVAIEAKVISVSPSATKQFGIEWGAGNFGNQLTDTHLEGTSNLKLPGSTDLRFGTVLSTFDVNAIVSLLEDQGQGETLSEPRITVLDNTQAILHAGQARTRLTRTDDNNVTQSSEDLGVTLQVTPQVVADDKVLLDIYVEVSSVAPEAAGQELINKDDATTKIMVDNGATAVIGGLMSTDRTTASSYVPFLGHLPVIGRLFQSKQDIMKKRELVIFVTPTVLKPPPTDYGRNIEQG